MAFVKFAQDVILKGQLKDVVLLVIVLIVTNKLSLNSTNETHLCSAEIFGALSTIFVSFPLYTWYTKY